MIVALEMVLCGIGVAGAVICGVEFQNRRAEGRHRSRPCVDQCDRTYCAHCGGTQERL